MDQQDSFPKDPYPTSKDLAAAIKNLPRPGPSVPPQKVEIVAGPKARRYIVTFVARQNPALSTPTWFWGVDNSERITVGQHGAK
jgi:hypothetical protein